MMAMGLRARFVFPAVVCLFCLLPNTVSAQCWYDAGVYADLYDNGVDAIEVYGAGWDGSYCPPCPHSYQFSATLWFNSSVVDYEYYDSAEGTASYGATESGWASYEVMFIINCACAGPIGVGPAGGSREVQRQAQAPSVSGPNELWWFNGVSPSGYATSVVLNSSAGAGTSWAVTAGSGLVSLSSNQGASVTVTSMGQSQNANDVTVTASNAAGSGSRQLTVRSPYRLEPGQIVTTCPQSQWGYTTTLRYTIKDNLGSNMPADVGIAEDWTSGVTNIFTGTNWRRGSPAGIVVPGVFDDLIGGEAPALPPNPAIVCGDSTDIQSWGQEWRVGSVTPSQGKLVQTDTLLKRRGSATHTNITSPP